ncbi:hypothetical protein BaRGS_00003150 [Batillaria attramentaria]|uniref:C1q domain-containing protein n=1 Tax=Batillaria attramentaria TaxID=370345 RepID=A0ABD0M1T9_9CAEN
MKLCAFMFVMLVLSLWYRPSHCGDVTSNRARRSDDTDPLEAVVMQQSAELNQLKAELAALQTKVDSPRRGFAGTLHRRVAFLVQAATDRTMPQSSPYKFDQIILNDGNGYDATLGVFTAPYAGVYILALQVFVNVGERPMLDITVNGNVVSRMALDTRSLPVNDESDSTTVVVKLKAQDRVWVQSLTGAYTYWGVFHTFFTGCLLYTTPE